MVGVDPRLAVQCMDGLGAGIFGVVAVLASIAAVDFVVFACFMPATRRSDDERLPERHGA